MDPEISKRLESLENGLKEVKDLYLSIKIEFMEIKKGISEGGVVQISPSPSIPEQPSPDITPLKTQMETMQKSLLELQDQYKLMKNEAKTISSIDMSQGKDMPSRLKNMMMANQKKMDELAEYKKSVDEALEKVDVVVKAPASLMERVISIENQLGNIKSTFLTKREVGSLESRLASMEKSILESDNLKRDFASYKNAVSKDIGELARRIDGFDHRVSRLVDYEKELIENFGEFQKDSAESGSDYMDRLKSQRSEFLSTRYNRSLKSVEPETSSIRVEAQGDEFGDKVKRLREVLDRI